MHVVRVKYQCRSCKTNEGVHLSQWYSMGSIAGRRGGDSSSGVEQREDVILVIGVGKK